MRRNPIVMQNNTLKSKRYLSLICLPLLFALPAALAGCSEESYGPPRGARAAETGSPDVSDASGARGAADDRSAQPKPSEPVLVVGDVTMPMPVPAGFKRIPADHPLMRATQSDLDAEETLLCLFERGGEAAPGEAGSEGTPKRELLQVSTLRKWLNVEVSSLDFLKITQPWQEESVEFNQSALSVFTEAVQGRLAAEPHFDYNLGLIDSSPLHISFMRVLKETAPGGEVGYICSTTSLVWRYGKILSITYNKPIAGFDQIQGVVAESVGYLQKLQAIDRHARLSSIFASPAASEPS